jgi:hypothetical protein
MTIFRSNSSGFVKGRKRSRLRTAFWNIFAVVVLIAMAFGPFYLARELYGTLSPSRQQIRAARAILAALLLAPFIVLFVRMWWQSRGSKAAPVHRRASAQLEDPSKQLQKNEQ